MTADKEFVSYVVDLMQGIGPVHAKAMFGGHGIFLQGLMFALIVDDTLYLKADLETREDFLRQSLPAFTYVNRGKEYTMSYFQAPDEVLEDIDMMNNWANSAYSVALRAAAR